MRSSFLGRTNPHASRHTPGQFSCVGRCGTRRSLLHTGSNALLPLWSLFELPTRHVGFRVRSAMSKSNLHGSVNGPNNTLASLGDGVPPTEGRLKENRNAIANPIPIGRPISRPFSSMPVPIKTVASASPSPRQPARRLMRTLSFTTERTIFSRPATR